MIRIKSVKKNLLFSIYNYNEFKEIMWSEFSIHLQSILNLLTRRIQQLQDLLLLSNECQIYGCWFEVGCEIVKVLEPSLLSEIKLNSQSRRVRKLRNINKNYGGVEGGGDSNLTSRLQTIWKTLIICRSSINFRNCSK